MTEKKGIIKDIKKLGKSEYAETGLVMATFAMALGDFLPTPLDAIWLMGERWLEKNRANLTPEKYYMYKLGNYYLPNGLYWTGLALLIYYLDVSFENKLKVFFGFIGAGAIFGIILKYILEDKMRIQEMKSTGQQVNAFGGIY